MAHTKPSKEELQANIDKAAAALETPPAPSPSPSQAVPSPSKAVPSSSQAVPSPSAPVPSPSPTPGVDYKKRYSDSSREAHVIASKNREMNKAVEDAANLPEPTEDELKAAYSEWDDMTPTEQRLAKDNLLNKKKFDVIHQATEKYKKVDEWQDKVVAFVEDPKTITKNPELDGKEEEFKTFASKPSRVGVDFDDLILAFLGEESKSNPKPKKGQMFPTGSGGPNDRPQPKDKRLSVEEGRRLRLNNYNEFKRQLKAKNIKNE